MAGRSQNCEWRRAVVEKRHRTNTGARFMTGLRQLSLAGLPAVLSRLWRSPRTTPASVEHQAAQRQPGEGEPATAGALTTPVADDHQTTVPSPTEGEPAAADAPAPAPVTPTPQYDRYLSCRFLERGATFYPGRIVACCANPATGKTPQLALMKNGELPVDALLEARKKIITRHKSGRIRDECLQCPRLSEEAWEQPGAMSPYAIDEVTIAYFTSCNIRCNYCYTVTDPHSNAPLSKQPRLLATFRQLIERELLAPNATVRFSGGEPTLSPEFETLLELLTNYGVRSVVYTNATKRSDAIMKALAKDKVELVLGIDAATVKTYKAIKKMNYHDKVWKVVAEYCAALPPNATNKVWAKFIFCLENYHEAAHFVERAHAAGARSVYYDFDSSRVYGGVERDGIPLPEEVCDHLAVLRHDCEKHGIAVEFAESGVVWFTPERKARVEREIERLRSQDAAELALSLQAVPIRTESGAVSSLN
jgi:uncharacterized Fe-S cluster-containing radical SAM superfamily protein